MHIKKELLFIDKRIIWTSNSGILQEKKRYQYKMEINKAGSIKSTCAKCCFLTSKCEDETIKNQLIKDNKNCVENEFSFYVDLYAKNYKEKRF